MLEGQALLMVVMLESKRQAIWDGGKGYAMSMYVLHHTASISVLNINIQQSKGVRFKNRV